MNILWGLLGILAIFAIAFLLSEHKSKINIRTILIGLAIQAPVRIHRSQMGNGEGSVSLVYKSRSASRQLCE